MTGSQVRLRDEALTMPVEKLGGPAFILGCPASGASMLSWALAQHSSLRPVLHLEWLLGVLSGVNLAARAAEAGAASPVVLPMQALEAAIGSTIRAGVVQEDKRLLAWTPTFAPYAPAVLRLFPDARFIHVVRPMHEVVRELVASPVPSGRSYTEEAARELWLAACSAGLAVERAYGVERVLRVRRRDLIEAPEATVRTCIGFLGEAFEAACLRPFTNLQPSDAANDVAWASKAFGGERIESLERELLGEPQAQEPDIDACAALEAACMRSLVDGQPLVDSMGLVEQVRGVVRSVLSPASSVIVISKGDDALLDLGGRQACHFPVNEDGGYAGYYPAGDDEAIAMLERLRALGYSHLVIPNPYYWWLNAYPAFARHLDERYGLVFYQENACMVFQLTGVRDGWRIRLQSQEDDSARGEVGQ